MAGIGCEEASDETVKQGEGSKTRADTRII